MTYISSYNEDEILGLFVGKKVVDVEGNTVVLSDGSRVTFDDGADDCCSWQELDGLTKVDNLITGARFTDTEDESFGESGYRYTLTVMTDAGVEHDLAQAHGDETNGYYLRGWSLGVTVDKPTENVLD